MSRGLRQLPGAQLWTLEKVCRFFSDGDDGSIEVAPRYTRHDRGVDDAQSFNTEDFRFGIDDTPHRTGATRMAVGNGLLLHEFPDIGVALRPGHRQVRSPHGIQSRLL